MKQRLFYVVIVLFNVFAIVNSGTTVGPDWNLSTGGEVPITTGDQSGADLSTTSTTAGDTSYVTTGSSGKSDSTGTSKTTSTSLTVTTSDMSNTTQHVTTGALTTGLVNATTVGGNHALPSPPPYNNNGNTSSVNTTALQLQPSSLITFTIVGLTCNSLWFATMFWNKIQLYGGFIASLVLINVNWSTTFQGFCTHFFGAVLTLPGPWDTTRGIENFYTDQTDVLYSVLFWFLIVCTFNIVLFAMMFGVSLGMNKREEDPTEVVQAMASPVLSCYYGLVIGSCYELKLHHEGSVDDILRFVIAFTLFMGCLAIPIVIFAFLRTRSKEWLEQNQILYGFLYNEYTYEYRTFYGIITLRRLFTGIFVAFARDSTITQVVMISIITLSYVAVVLKWKPFVSGFQMLFELLSNFTFFIAVWLILVDQSNKSICNSSIALYVMTLVFAFIGGVFSLREVRYKTERPPTLPK